VAARERRNYLRFDGVNSAPRPRPSSKRPSGPAFPDGPGEKASQRMRRPARRLEQLLGSLAVLPPQHFEDRSGFAPGSAAGCFLRAFGRFLRRVAFLPDFPFFGATSRARFATLAFVVASGSAAVAWAAASSLVNVVIFSPFSGGFRDHMNRSDRAHRQANCDVNLRWQRTGDGVARMDGSGAPCRQMS
jgi:hypothetical protein